MLLSAVFLAFLTLIVVMGLLMIIKANLDEKEKRDSVLLIAILFLTVLTLNEIQNLHLAQPSESNYLYKNFQEVFPSEPISIQQSEDDSTLIGRIFPNRMTDPPILALVPSPRGIASLVKYLESEGAQFASISINQQSQICWDRQLSENVFTRAIEYSIQKKDQNPTLIVEYSSCKNLITALGELYRFGNLNLILYGNQEQIENVQLASETFFWMARLIT